MSSSVSLEYLNTVIGGGATGFTVEGGIYITVINATGSNSVKGTIVSTSTATDDAVMITPANSIMPIGVIYENGIATGQPVKVAISGKAYVLMKNGQSATRGFWVGCSDNAGRAYMIVDPPSTSLHSSEIGHSLETKTSGTNVLALIDLHFN